MEQGMTMQEIQTQFDDEWVLVVDPQTDAGLHVLNGKVICHSKDRDEVNRQAVALRPARCAVLFTGQIPENTAVVL